MGCSNSRRVRDVYALSSNQPNRDELVEMNEMRKREQEEDKDLTDSVELFIKCEGLPNLDRTTLTDPMAVLFLQDEEDNWINHGFTEIQKNNLHPEFTTAFKVSYCFERTLMCKVSVYDIRDFQNPRSLIRQNLIGHAIFSIHEIVCSPEKSMQKNITKKGKAGLGTVIVFSEPSSHSPQIVHMRWALVQERIRGFVYLLFYRCGGHEIPIHQTEAKLKRPLTWNNFEIQMQRLCQNNPDLPLKVNLMRMDEKKSDQLIGSASFTFSDLCDSFQLPLKRGEKKVCDIRLVRFEVEDRYSFLDYILGGCEISLIVGIDFTKSNEEKRLHGCEDNRKTQYAQAILSVGEILQHYDTDKKIPAFGFGAKIPPEHTIVSHCFALNGNVFDPEVQGISGLIKAYQDTLDSVVMHGPTVFHEVLDMSALYASAFELSQDRQQYFLVMLLTDGNIDDLRQTVDSIAYLSTLPVSIIIIGIGDGDFSTMDTLDADVTPLYSEKYKRIVDRDIVQFVPFSQFKDHPELLAKQVLDEVPSQMVSFMTSKGITPNYDYDEEIKVEESHPASFLLTSKKRKFISSISALGFDPGIVYEIVERGIPCINTNLVINNIHMSKKHQVKQVTRKKKSARVSLNSTVNLCFLCDRPAEVEFKCGHTLTCQDCSKNVGSVCPACHSKI